MRKVLVRRRMEEWLRTLPPGSEFTARDVCDACPCYMGTNTREITNYLRTTAGVRKEGRCGDYVRYVWEGDE